MAPAWPRPLTYIRAFNNFSSLRPLEQPEGVWQELDQRCRRSLLKYKPYYWPKKAKKAFRIYSRQICHDIYCKFRDDWVKGYGVMGFDFQSATPLM